jgi:hypothetical protein
MCNGSQRVVCYDNGSSISTKGNRVQQLCPRTSIAVRLGGFKNDTVSYLGTSRRVFMAAFEGVEPSPIAEWPRVQAPFVPGTPNALTGAPGLD